MHLRTPSFGHLLQVKPSWLMILELPSFSHFHATHARQQKNLKAHLECYYCSLHLHGTALWKCFPHCPTKRPVEAKLVCHVQKQARSTTTPQGTAFFASLPFLPGKFAAYGPPDSVEVTKDEAENDRRLRRCDEWRNHDVSSRKLVVMQ